MRKLAPALLTLPLALCACGGGSSTPETSTEPEQFTVTEYEAQVQCKEVVENNLKTPSTAVFPRSSDWEFTPIIDGYKVAAYVDAQNSFGATVRLDFQCTVTANPDGSESVMRSLDYINQR